MGNEGINRLARALDGRSKEHGDKPALLDFGEIRKDRSLVTNEFPCPIPQSDYMVCRLATRNPQRDKQQEVTPIGPGDRVLVVWVGDDAVVIDRILPATVI